MQREWAYMMTIQAAKQYRTSFEMRYCSICMYCI